MNQTIRYPINNAAAGFAGAHAGPRAPGLVERMRQYFATRRALSEVRSLDARMLRDIGLDAAQIEEAVRGKY